MHQIVQVFGKNQPMFYGLMAIFGIGFSSQTRTINDFVFWANFTKWMLCMVVASIPIAIICAASYTDQELAAMKQTPSQEKDVQQNEGGGKD